MYRCVFPLLLLFGAMVNGCASIASLYGKEVDNLCRVSFKSSYFEVEVGVDESIIESFVLPEKRLVDDVCDILANIIENNNNRRGHWVWESYKYKNEGRTRKQR